MNLNPPSVAARIRSLRSRHLSPDAYLRELVMLADLHHDVGSSGANSVLAEVDRVVELRDRIAILERKVKELESQK